LQGQKNCFYPFYFNAGWTSWKINDLAWLCVLVDGKMWVFMKKNLSRFF